ncbi:MULTISPECIES: hypothetical protein [unclassified Okeania]|nr:MULTISPECIES: hypothetical protein [unclassified Okeania]
MSLSLRDTFVRMFAAPLQSELIKKPKKRREEVSQTVLTAG